MENKEIILIAILASISSFITWYVLMSSNPDDPVLGSYYSIFLFPPLFCLLFLFLRKMIKA